MSALPEAVDRLARPLSAEDRLLPAEHPERFLTGDLVQIVESGEVVMVEDVRLRVIRGLGSVRPSPAEGGSPLSIMFRER